MYLCKIRFRKLVFTQTNQQVIIHIISVVSNHNESKIHLISLFRLAFEDFTWNNQSKYNKLTTRNLWS